MNNLRSCGLEAMLPIFMVVGQMLRDPRHRRMARVTFSRSCPNARVPAWAMKVARCEPPFRTDGEGSPLLFRC